MNEIMLKQHVENIFSLQVEFQVLTAFIFTVDFFVVLLNVSEAMTSIIS